MAVDWLDAFDRDEQRRHLSKATIVSRHRTLSDFLNYCDPATCGREDVERWLDSRRLTARSRATKAEDQPLYIPRQWEDDALAFVSEIIQEMETQKEV